MPNEVRRVPAAVALRGNLLEARQGRRKVDEEHLSPEIGGGLPPVPRELGLNVRGRIDALETTLVREALERTRGNQTQAAKLLGISRGTLVSRLERFGVSRPRKKR